jgi:chromosome transmission fidelity protein 18
MQAGYEIMEINASDERSSNVVKGRIRTTVGTESVKAVSTTIKDGKAQKVARPVCVVVDEVDGVVTGSGGSGEGGFIKALIDLVHLDAKNEVTHGSDTTSYSRKKKKGDNFRLLRPLILICNDVYHPSLRPLRQSSFAEVIHIRKPPLEAVVKRMKSVFEKEGIACDNDGVRKLCEATWGMSSGPEARPDASGTGEGDLRGLLVVGEWVAGKLRSSNEAKPKLTRKWVEQHVLSDLSHGGGGTRGVGRGGVKEVVSRVFLTGAGFPKPASEAPVQPVKGNADTTLPRAKLHASEIAKKAGMDRLREMVDTSGDIDRIVTDIFSVYPSQPFNDDTILSKPDAAYEWLHFHDACSSRVYSDQDWELMPYLSQPVLACHHLFASSGRHYSSNPEQKKWNNDEGEAVAEKEIPFSGPRADYDAKEAEKSCRATITELQSSLNATLLRSFRSPEDIATDLLPYLVRMLAPDVKPIIVGGSGDQRGIASVRKEGEREMVKRAVDVMSSLGVKFERGKLEGDFGNRGSQWVYRMEP